MGSHQACCPQLGVQDLTDIPPPTHASTSVVSGQCPVGLWSHGTPHTQNPLTEWPATTLTTEPFLSLSVINSQNTPTFMREDTGFEDINLTSLQILSPSWAYDSNVGNPSTRVAPPSDQLHLCTVSTNLPFLISISCTSGHWLLLFHPCSPPPSAL